MVRPKSPAASRPSRIGIGASHTLAGFTLGVLAVAVGVLFGSPGADGAPLAQAARDAEQVAAVRMTLDPAARPAAEPPVLPVAFVQPEEEGAEGAPAALLAQRHATRLAIPAVGLDAIVSPVGLVYRDGQLRYDVPRVEAGQYAGTAAPGEAGNTVIGGHVARLGVAGVFQALPHVAAGDMVEVYRGDELFRYSITEIRVVAADATDVMGPTQEATLTLITCFPNDNYAERLVVIGKLV